jgi:hypothetical protein
LGRADNNNDAFVAQFGAAALFDPDDPFVMVKGEYKYLPVLCTPVIVPGLEVDVRPPQAAAISCSADRVAQSDDQIDGDREDHRSKEVGEQHMA